MSFVSDHELSPSIVSSAAFFLAAATLFIFFNEVPHGSPTALALALTLLFDRRFDSRHLASFTGSALVLATFRRFFSATAFLSIFP